jgi:hypothetical protein
VWGGSLSLYELGTGRWTSCKCRNGKCKKVSHPGSGIAAR